MPKDSALQNGKGGGKAVIIGGAVIIVSLVAVIVVLLTGQRDGDAKKSEKRNVVVNQQNAEKAVEELINEPYIAPGYYSVQMETTWHFQTGDAVSEDAYVANDAGNTNDVYFDIFLAENESKPILKSPVIPRGAEFHSIALDEPLEAGTYDCVMVYHLVDEEQNDVSTVRVGFTIVVER